MSRGWRPFALIAASILTLVGLAMFLIKAGPVLLILGGVALAALMIDRPYRAPSVETRRDPRWQPTDERFTDPETGLITRVWYDPQTGERHYVAEGQPRA